MQTKYESSNLKTQLRTCSFVRDIIAWAPKSLGLAAHNLQASHFGRQSIWYWEGPCFKDGERWYQNASQWRVLELLANSHHWQCSWTGWAYNLPKNLKHSSNNSGLESATSASVRSVECSGFLDKDPHPQSTHAAQFSYSGKTMSQGWHHHIT